MKTENKQALTLVPIPAKVKNTRPNPRWTKITATRYIEHATYKGLTYWSAKDYLTKHGGAQ